MSHVALRTWKKSLAGLVLPLQFFTITFGAVALASYLPIALAAGETCNGLPATIVGSGTINGTNGDDVIVGSAGNDVINAGNGNDTICSLGGNDTINAGNGNDWVDAGEGNNTVNGENGNDTLYAGAGNDTMNGGNHTDTCSPGTGSNTVSNCETIIVTPVCGNGTQEGTEECDDGNTNNNDACLNTCELAECGDGFTRTGVEECDDGNGLNSDACTNACELAECGDGYVYAGVEVCDDGNDDETDSCLNTCVAASCGDGVVQAGEEECDDGNGIDTDACLNTCEIAVCGDSVVQIGVEACDTGGVNTGSCDADCTAPVCGDNVINLLAGEQCDGGNAVGGDGCSAFCALEVCGNQIIDPLESCDDGNAEAGDGCHQCKLEICGDGVVDFGEECDDLNNNDGDGCSAACAVETGFACALGDPSVCTATCGDGMVVGEEEGDDGDDSAGDGCSDVCEIEDGYTCEFEPSVCSGTCGDGIVTVDEQCDDGNDEAQDGCTAACVFDVPFCNGVQATIYAQGGFIVGGPNNGAPYTGTLTGTNGDDVMFGTMGDDVIQGKDGNDVLCGFGGNDTLQGGDGNDLLIGNDGDDQLDGGKNDDVLCGNGGDDELLGKQGNDKLDGSSGTDSLKGQNNHDICYDGESNIQCEDTTTPVPECAASNGSGGSSSDGGSSSGGIGACEETGLVGYWNFDEAAGSVAADATANGNDGTHNGGVTVSTIVAPGVTPNPYSLLFDGADDSVSVPDADALDLTTYTVSAWVNPSTLSLGSNDVVVAKGGAGYGSYNYLLYFSTGNDNTVTAYNSGLTPPALNANVTIPAGSWSHIAMTYDGFTRKIFVDGVLAGSDTPTGTPVTGAGNLEIGSSDGGQFNFPGQIDDVRLYNVALSEDAIADLGNECSVSSGSSSSGGSSSAASCDEVNGAGLVVYWPFDEGSGASTADDSGNGHAGTLASPVWTGTAAPTDFANPFALDFDGVDDMVTTPSANAFNVNNLSVSAWIRTESTSGYKLILRRSRDGIGEQYSLYLNGDELEFWSYDLGLPSDHLGTTDANFQENVWYHVAAVFDAANNTLRLYVNGVEKASAVGVTGNFAISTQPLHVGAIGAYPWNGQMDDVRVYSRVLNASEVADLADGCGGTTDGAEGNGSSSSTSSSEGSSSSSEGSSSSAGIGPFSNLESTDTSARRGHRTNEFAGFFGFLRRLGGSIGGIAPGGFGGGNVAPGGFGGGPVGSNGFTEDQEEAICRLQTRLGRQDPPPSAGVVQWAVDQLAAIIGADASDITDAINDRGFCNV